MKRKFIIGTVIAAVLSLGIYMVISRGKTTHRYRSGGDAMTVVVELPKTNKSAASGVRYERDKPR